MRLTERGVVAVVLAVTLPLAFAIGILTGPFCYNAGEGYGYCKTRIERVTQP